MGVAPAVMGPDRIPSQGLSPAITRVGVAGFEPTTSSSRTKHATKLRHTPCEATTAYRTGCRRSQTHDTPRDGMGMSVVLCTLTNSNDRNEAGHDRTGCIALPGLLRAGSALAVPDLRRAAESAVAEVTGSRPAAGPFELGEHVVLTAEVAEMTQRRMKNRRGSMANAVIVDDAGQRALVTFFSAHPHYGILRRAQRQRILRGRRAPAKPALVQRSFGSS